MKEDWTLRHLGFIVRDMDKATEYYRSRGIAVLGTELPIAQSPDGSKLRVKFARAGSLVLEFFQPFGGDSMQLRFLKKHGEGIQHMAFAVSNIDDEVDKLVGRGIKLVFRGDMPTGTRIAYLDTGEVGDFLVELVQPAEKDSLAGMLTAGKGKQQNKDWETHHLGFIVSDMDKAIALYKSLGVAKIGRELPVMQTRKGAKVKARFVQVGDILLEFFQPVEGEDTQSEFLRKHGEGIQHIGFTVANLDAEADALAKNDVKVVFRIDYPTNTHIAYFDTAQIGDVLIELIQPSDKNFLANALRPD